MPKKFVILFRRKMVNVHLLAGQDICHRNCSVAIYSYTDNGNTLWNKRYSLLKTSVIFGNESGTDKACPTSLYLRDSYMHVNCSTWKHGMENLTGRIEIGTAL